MGKKRESAHSNQNVFVFVFFLQRIPLYYFFFRALYTFGGNATSLLSNYSKILLIGVILITVLCVTAIGMSGGAIAIATDQRSQIYR